MRSLSGGLLKYFLVRFQEKNLTLMFYSDWQGLNQTKKNVDDRKILNALPNKLRMSAGLAELSLSHGYKIE